jgi:hypothetical protein
MHSIMTDTTCTTAFANQEAIMKDRRTRECIGMTFPFKLYEMLQDAEKEGDTCIVSWRHHGNAFTVHEPAVFCENIMPYYFNQSKYKSFQRQVSSILYGAYIIGDTRILTKSSSVEPIWLCLHPERRR